MILIEELYYILDDKSWFRFALEYKDNPKHYVAVGFYDGNNKMLGHHPIYDSMKSNVEKYVR